MPKPRDAVIDHKRRLSLLDRLDGGAYRCADGVFLIEPRRVHDPRPLLAACENGRPSSAALRAAMAPCPPPVFVGRELLAAAHRDLKVIEGAPEVRALSREAPRIFRRYGELDDAWVERKRARLALLSEMVREAEARPVDRPSAWFDRVLALVRLLHGDAAVEALASAEEALIDGAHRRRREAKRALAEVTQALAGERSAASPKVDEALSALRAAARLPGRARARRVSAILSALLGVGEGAVPHAAIEAALPLGEQVRAVGARLLGAREKASSAGLRERARRALAPYAIAFDPRPRDGSALVLRPEQIDLAASELRAALSSFGERRLRLAEVLALLALPTQGRLREQLAKVIEGGFPIALLPGLAAIDQLESLTVLGDARAAEAYASFALTLVPHYRSLGLDVPIRPEMFASLKSARREDLATLAVCLIKHHTTVGPDGAEQAIARLDATLGLFRTRPAEAASVLGELTGTSKGAGRAAFPAFAAWLGDDALLDRFVHLTRLAGAPVSLSRTLRSDFDRAAALAGERAYLASLEARTEKQEARLQKLDRGGVAVPDAAWTRRRLEERVRELSSLAYEVRLAAVMRGLVKEVWGISVPSLSPGFRDAIRFYLAVDQNRELLGTVLRGAAAGVDPRRSLPENAAWIEKARGRFDVEAWLAPRARDVMIGGAAHRLAIERDPVEVLRMGIPFGTCLSLDDGCNAASTVINAADANKQVIYLRDRGGSIVARKLVAVSTDGALIGYHLYVAAKEHREEIGAAFEAFTAELAAAAKIPRAAAGTPAQLHKGFWYDDGTEPFGGGVDAVVEGYCRSLGVPAPSVVDARLRAEASMAAAIAEGDEATVRQRLAEVGWSDGPFVEAAIWLIERLAPEAVIAEARRSSAVAHAAARRAAARGPLALLELAGKIGGGDIGEIVARGLSRSPRTAEIAMGLVAAGLSARAAASDYDDHGLEHQSTYLLPAYAAEIPLQAALALCDRVAPLWAQIIQASQGGCRDCVIGAEHEILEAIARRYPAGRDPDRVIACLESGRAGLLAKRAALRIAARFALADDVASPSAPLRPSPAALRALSRLRQRTPELAQEPDLLAAVLRQSAGTLPHGVALPVPREAPFEELGDLLLSSELDLAGVLAPWLAPPDPASSWSPGPWELYYHRRQRTPLRAALFAEARERAPLACRATDALAFLGDVEALAALDDGSAAPRRKQPRSDGTAKLGNLTLARQIAGSLAAQVAAADGGGPLRLASDALHAPVRALDGHGRAVDQGLVRAALAVVDRHLAQVEADDDLERAFEVLIAGGTSTATLADLVDRLLARGEPSDSARGFMAAFLRERVGYRAAELGPARVIALARVEGLRTPLFEALAKTDDPTPIMLSTLDRARAEVGEGLAEDLLDGWTRALAARGDADAIAAIDDDALFPRVVAVLLRQGNVAPFLQVYKDTRSHAQAARMLRLLAESPLLGAPGTRAAIEAMRAWGADPENTARFEWLAAVCRKRGSRRA